MFALAFSLSVAILAAGLFRVGPTHTRSQELIVIDTDPGIDDAVALLTVLGDPKYKVLGITVVRGNTDVPQVVINTLKILQIANALDIPVYTGQNLGLIDSPISDGWFGKDGFGDLPFDDPPTADQAQQSHAASFLARAVRRHPGNISILATGPLTNIALAVHINPKFLKQVKRIIILGGSIRGRGNAAPGVEFNFYMDADAAAVVLDRALYDGVLLTHVPMETVLGQDLGKDWRWNTFGKIDNSVVSFLNTLEQGHLQRHPSEQYYPFDTYAAAVALTKDAVISSTFLYGFVENRGHRSKGAMLIDYFNVTGNKANLQVVVVINTTVVQDVMMANLANFN